MGWESILEIDVFEQVSDLKVDIKKYFDVRN